MADNAFWRSDAQSINSVCEEVERVGFHLPSLDVLQFYRDFVAVLRQGPDGEDEIHPPQSSTHICTKLRSQKASSIKFWNIRARILKTKGMQKCSCKPMAVLGMSSSAMAV
ncbi:unnamed protein product [Schistosoma mattheei]|uniref:Uncharacterized protein n=1 Tax=Schistosoma mattheei TaxID=31246 RepID=A0A183NXZ8_9TREM|nr:unnamed protein product [Schistosoma mattheei]